MIVTLLIAIFFLIKIYSTIVFHLDLIQISLIMNLCHLKKKTKTIHVITTLFCFITIDCFLLQRLSVSLRRISCHGKILFKIFMHTHTLTHIKLVLTTTVTNKHFCFCQNLLEKHLKFSVLFFFCFLLSVFVGWPTTTSRDINNYNLKKKK